MSNPFANTNVLMLEPSDFSGNMLTVNGKPMPGKVLVFIYASYCGYCKNMVPAIIELAKKYNPHIGNPKKQLDNNSILIVVVQGDSNDESHRQALAKLQNMTSIRGYPTIPIFKNGKLVQNYDGQRTLEAIDSHLKRL